MNLMENMHRKIKEKLNTINRCIVNIAPIDYNILKQIDIVNIGPIV